MQKKFNVEGMSCSACSASVERAVSRLDGVLGVVVNLLGKSMLCDYDEEKISPADIIAAVEKAGFSASEAKPEAESKPAKVKESGDGFTPVKTRLIISICFLVPLMVLSMGHMLGIPLPAFLDFEENPANAVAYAFLQFLLTLPVLYVNRKFFAHGFPAVFRGSANMDSLIALGSSASLIYGIFSIFMMISSLAAGDTGSVLSYAHNLYFESAAMILTLVTVGKFLEERSKGKTGKALEALLDLAPKTATVLRDGKEVSIPAEEIIVGDILPVKPGERIAVDGTVIGGLSSVDESALTGESMPVEKTTGSTVLSASINQSGALTVRADKVGGDTTFAKIIELVENAGASKAPVARLADKISGIFVPVVSGIAAVTLIVWLLIGKSFDFSLSRAISVLVISCPCALGLATPVAITVATGKCASKGIMIKSADALETLCRCDTVILDKTGTVTTGKPSVTDVIPVGISERELLGIAASLEKNSSHPLAKAITSAAGDDDISPADEFSSVAGRGVTAKINGNIYFGGNAEYMRDIGCDIASHKEKATAFSSEGKTVMYFSDGKKLIGIIAAGDKVRKTSAAAIEKMRLLGEDVILLTGDSRPCAERIAKSVGIENVVAEVLPSDKESTIASLREGGKHILMIGDGINDSPALARADVGMAIGEGTDIAIESAEVVLMKSDLRDAADALEYSRRTMKIIKQNLFWAFFYNIIGIPIAAGVLSPLGVTLNPMIAAAAMSVSSLFVVTNALRLYKK